MGSRKLLRKAQWCAGGSLAFAIAMASSTAALATDDSTALRQEISQMKQRLADLESKTARSAYASSLSTDQLKEALSQLITFNGYFRAGAGLSGKGTDQATFKAPGAGAKYRLGNEADGYGELTFGLKQQASPSDAWFRTEVMTSFASNQDKVDDADNDKFAFRQAFVEAGNLDFLHEDVKIWAGKRYYMREDIHINDYFFLDMSGNGAGVLDIPVMDGFGKFAAAFFVGSNTDSLTDEGSPAKVTGDFRLYDVSVPLGKVTFWVSPSQITESGSFTDTNGLTRIYEETDGISLGLIHKTDSFFGYDGFNKLAVLWGKDAGADFTTNVFQAATTATDYGIKGDKTTIVTNSGSADFNDNWSMMYAFVYKLSDNGGASDNSEVNWTSFGIRPIYHFTENLALAVETGIDYVDNEVDGYNGSLYKITIAPEIRPNTNFFGRPVLRLFATYSTWSDDFNGTATGVNTTYRNDTEGTSFGAQVETWW
jgi:maltoporin